MKDKCLIVVLLVIIIYMVYVNSNVYEYMDASPYMYIPEGYGEHGQYYDNVELTPVYRTIKVPTIFD